MTTQSSSTQCNGIDKGEVSFWTPFAVFEACIFVVNAFMTALFISVDAEPVIFLAIIAATAGAALASLTHRFILVSTLRKME